MKPDATVPSALGEDDIFELPRVYCDVLLETEDSATGAQRVVHSALVEIEAEGAR